MPWKETCPVDERNRFIDDYLSTFLSFSELCRHYGISRKTGYKWIDRFDQSGRPGLEDQSRRPHGCTHATDPEIVAAIVQARKRHPLYSAKKIRPFLLRRHPDWDMPSITTVHNILKRNNLIPTKRRNPKRGHPGRPYTTATEPNTLWTTDFKGHFKTKNGRYCYPLTIQDAYSRYLLACDALLDTSITTSIPVFERVFKEHGIPTRIRSDNGAPFASNALGRLSRLSVWWIQLGITPELIEPGKPHQNGQHENMHGTLKKHATRPPQRNCSAQQQTFNSFIHEFNHIRPHESLNNAVPADRYSPSTRPFPTHPEPISYPPHFEVRRVSRNGGIRWAGTRIPVSHILIELEIALEEVDHGSWDVYFGPVWLGRLVEAKGRIIDRFGKQMRQQRL